MLKQLANMTTEKLIEMDEIKVYIKAENGAVRVFLPEEW